MPKLKLKEKELSATGMALSYLGCVLQDGVSMLSNIARDNGDISNVFFKDCHNISDDLRKFMNGDREQVKLWILELISNINSTIKKTNDEIVKAASKQSHH